MTVSVYVLQNICKRIFLNKIKWNNPIFIPEFLLYFDINAGLKSLFFFLFASGNELEIALFEKKRWRCWTNGQRASLVNTTLAFKSAHMHFLQLLWVSIFSN